MNTGTDTARTFDESRKAFVEKIKAYMARKNVTRTGFGRDALRDGRFVGRVLGGSDVRLRTADKVLAHMGLEPVGRRFLEEIEAFLKVTRTKPYVFGEEAMSDPTFVLKLERGRSPTFRTFDRVRAYMTDKSSAAEREAVRAAVEDGATAVPVGRAKRRRGRCKSTST